MNHNQPYDDLIRENRETFRRLSLAASGAMFVEVEPQSDDCDEEEIIDDDRCSYCDERAGSCRHCQAEHAADLRGDD